MKRRTFLTGLGIATTTTLGGCMGGSGLNTQDAQSPPPLVRNRPDAVYHPTHFETMQMIGTKESGGQTLALMYTFPHRFWTMETSTRTKKVSIADEDSVHMMASVWYPDSEVSVVDASPSLEIRKDGQTVVGNNNPWSMLSQPMGFHFGDNIGLDGEGTYTVSIDTSAPTLRRTGSLDGAGGRGSFEFEFEFSGSKLDALTVNTFPDKKGSRTAVPTMDMSIPFSYAPLLEDVPGEVLGTARSGDAKFVATRLSDGAKMGATDSESYLAVSPRTPYNEYILPGMSLTATVDRNGTTVFDGALLPTLDPDLDHHYGAAVPPLESGDQVTVSIQSPPQVARHEGYETAFLEMPSVTFDV